jgi:hypothetical protein
MTISEKEEKRGIGEALRLHGPIIVLAALCVWAYVDLKSDLARIAQQRESAAPAIAPHPPEQEAPTEPPVEPPPAPPTEIPPPPAPSVDWECEGAIEHEKVIEAVGKHGQAVFDCYSETLRSVPDLKGTLLLELNVDGEGQVREARVKGPVKEQALLACVSESVYGWTFTPPSGGECAVVSVPFLLDPKDHAPEPEP